MHPDDTCPDGAVRIPLRARDGSIRAYAIVDAVDADWLNQWRWHLDNRGYAVRTARSDGRLRMIQMHRAVLGLTPGDGLEGDHINRDRLDNRRSNLRSVTKIENRQNIAGRPGSSMYRGVYWNKAASKWQAYISISGTYRYLGLFTDEHEAGRVARAARLSLMGGAVD